MSFFQITKIRALDRPEAVAVLNEVYETCRESILITCVSVDSQVSDDSNGYEIRMRCILDGHSRNCLALILEKHGLGIREEKDYVILYSLPSRVDTFTFSSRCE